MKPWRELVPGGFADDGSFGVHPCDERRAKQAICAAIEAGASFDDFQNAMFLYLHRKRGRCDPEFWSHAARQFLTARWYWGDMAGRQPGDPLFGLELG
jgi:hypothetical protein